MIRKSGVRPFRRRMRQHNKKGFTLVELLVVIGIIAVLTSIAVIALGSARRKARDAKRVADVKAIQNALELYYQESNGYPTESPAVELGQGSYKALCSTGFETTCGGTATEFMGLVPTAPLPMDGGCSAGQNRYMYAASAGGAYDITFCLGDNFGDYLGGMRTATEDGIN